LVAALLVAVAVCGCSLGMTLVMQQFFG